MSRNRISPETWEQIKVAHAAGIGLREVARNMGIPEGTVLSYAKRKYLTQQIQTAKSATRSEQSDAITPSTMQSVAITMQQRGERHVERMAGISERVVDHVETMPPAEVLDSIDDVEKLDRMARRNYGLDDSTGAGGSLSLRVLTGAVALDVSAAR